MISEVVSPAEAGVIPDRFIDDNILLATELIKGYSSAHVSPRCVIKVEWWTLKKPMTLQSGVFWSQCYWSLVSLKFVLDGSWLVLEECLILYFSFSG